MFYVCVILANKVMANKVKIKFTIVSYDMLKISPRKIVS